MMVFLNDRNCLCVYTDLHVYVLVHVLTSFPELSQESYDNYLNCREEFKQFPCMME